MLFSYTSETRTSLGEGKTTFINVPWGLVLYLIEKRASSQSHFFVNIFAFMALSWDLNESEKMKSENFLDVVKIGKATAW